MGFKLFRTERTGTNDPGKPELIVHWIVTGLGWIALLSAAGYTQFLLTKMYFAKNVRVMMLDHPHMVSCFYILGTLWSFIPLLKNAAWVPIPCSAYVIITQICGNYVISSFVYRTLKFTYRMARVQSCKQYMLNEKSDEKEKKRFEEEKKFIKRVCYLLQGKRSMYISIGIFIFGLLTVFMDPFAIKQLMDQTNYCSLRTSTYLVVCWIMFVVPYLLALPDLIGTVHWTLIGNHLLCIFLAILWYCESWIPLQLTKKNIALAEADTSNMHKLIDTIANPVLLHKFEQHLIGEWSHETLQFYKRAVLFQIDATEIYRQYSRWFSRNEKSLERVKKLKSAQKDLTILRRRARDIYQEFIMEDAENQVNLAKDAVKLLHDFFSDEIFLSFEGILINSTGSSRSELFYGESFRQQSQSTICLEQKTPQRPSYPRQSRDQLENVSSKSVISDVASTPEIPKKKINILPDSASPRSTSQVLTDSVVSRTLSQRKSRIWQGRDEKSSPRVSIPESCRNSLKVFKIKPPSSTSIEKRLTSKNFCKTLVEAMNRGTGIVAEEDVKLCVSRQSITSSKIPIVVKEIKYLSTKFDKAKKATFDLMETDSHRRFRLALKHEEGLHRV
ncbi:hypothetical protein AAMO2058_001373000 [Amorphochlora amoebiformis]